MKKPDLLEQLTGSGVFFYIEKMSILAIFAHFTIGNYIEKLYICYNWDSDFKVLKDPEETKHKVWTMKEYRVLWQCFEISKLKGESGWKERMESAWRGADMRDVSLRSLVNKLRDIKFGKLCLLERESIGRRVKGMWEFPVFMGWSLIF